MAMLRTKDDSPLVIDSNRAEAAVASLPRLARRLAARSIGADRAPFEVVSLATAEAQVDAFFDANEPPAKAIPEHVHPY